MAYLISWSSGDGGRTFFGWRQFNHFWKKGLVNHFWYDFLNRDSRFNHWIDKWPVVNDLIFSSQLLNCPPNSFIVTFKTLFSLISISCSLSEFNGQSVAKSFGFFHGHRTGHQLPITVRWTLSCELPFFVEFVSYSSEKLNVVFVEHHFHYF